MPTYTSVVCVCVCVPRDVYARRSYTMTAYQLDALSGGYIVALFSHPRPCYPFYPLSLKSDSPSRRGAGLVFAAFRLGPETV